MIANQVYTKQGHVIEYDEINGKQASGVIALSDAALANSFKLTAREADHVLNYDIKYRMMLGADDDQGDD